MNLHEIVRSSINSVNPDQSIQIKVYSGYVQDEFFNSVPSYNEPVEAIAQIQPVASEEIEFINNYNYSKKYMNFYISGDWRGLNRREGSGGDIILWNGFEWFIDDVPEDWSPTAGWTKVRGVQQLP